MDVGFKVVNFGFLVGLYDFGEELVNILCYVLYLENWGVCILVLLLRLRLVLNVVN